MFAWRRRLGAVEMAVTDRSVDLLDPADCEAVREALEADRIAAMRQVHGAEVAWAGVEEAEADALATEEPGVAVVARAADCLPVVLVGDERIVAAVHAGRAGVAAGVVPAAVAALRGRGAGQVRAWLGPRICGACYEVPEAMAAEVEAVAPGSRAVTSWGTPSVDLAAGVRRQLAVADVDCEDLVWCTAEDDRFFSHRGGDLGRHGVVVVIHDGPTD
ncbi:MAG: polyphenol oxidase family protein [Aeromicrobium sp.]|uniref:polyphenol oxidase family protein n=1 Tax=Aeromicrobium sp. TaxID=1871063 RepID=UPI0039E4D1BC